MEILCPFCQATNTTMSDEAGGRIRCRNCGQEFVVPAVGQAADPGANSHLTAVGVGNIVLGVFSLLWMCFGIFMVIAMISGFADAEMSQQGGLEDKNEIAIFYGVIAVLAFVSGLLQCLAGIGVLRRKASSRILGIISSIINIISIWGCCVYLFALPVGIYSLVILMGQKASAALTE